LLSTATYLWESDNEVKSDPFDKVRLVIYKIGQGSAKLPVKAIFEAPDEGIEVAKDKSRHLSAIQTEDPRMVCLRQSVAVTAANTNSFARKEPLPHKVPGGITWLYPNVYSSIGIGESARISIPVSNDKISPEDAAVLPKEDGRPLVTLSLVEAWQRDVIAEAVAKEAPPPEPPVPAPPPEPTPPAEPANATQETEKEYKLQKRITDLTTSTRRAAILWEGREVGIRYRPEDDAEFLDAYANRKTHQISIIGSAVKDTRTGALLRIEALTYAKSRRVFSEQLPLFGDLESALASGGHGAKITLHVSPTLPLTSTAKVPIEDGQSALADSIGDSDMQHAMSLEEAKEQANRLALGMSGQEAEAMLAVSAALGQAINDPRSPQEAFAQALEKMRKRAIELGLVGEEDEGDE
jgi:hypothetical protein